MKSNQIKSYEIKNTPTHPNQAVGFVIKIKLFNIVLRYFLCFNI